MLPLTYSLLAVCLGLSSLAAATQHTDYVQLPTAQATSAAYDDSYSIFQPIMAQQAIVATEEHHATEVGTQVLQNGGNVVDAAVDRKSTRLNSSHVAISYAVFCLKKKKRRTTQCD